MTVPAPYQPILPPDARTYIAAAAGYPVASPFRWRVGWPVVLRAVGAQRHPTEPGAVVLPERLVTWWQLVPAVSAGLVVLALGWRAGLLVLALPMARQWWRWGLMPDAPAFGLACLSAWGVTVGTPWGAAVAVGAAVASGALHERAPVMAALWCWSPLPLVGLVVPAVAAVLSRVGRARDDEARVTDHPVRTALLALQQPPTWLYVVPWGGVLLALAAPVPWTVWVVLAVAYGQCLVAVDRARLYQWAAPAVAPLAVAVAGDWWPLAVVATLAVPWEWAAVAGSRWTLVLGRTGT
jgi:hypothetical protein